MVPIPSEISARGLEKRAAPPTPSAKPAAPLAAPATVVTTPPLTMRTALFAESATNKEPDAASHATPCGLLKRARRENPSLKPMTRGVPAKVLTRPRGEIARIA